MDLSIVFGTYNRRKYLIDCIESIRVSAGSLDYEIIVVDAGSDDGSREYLAVQPDVVFLGERALEGAIIAFNKGFFLARGWAVANINDDLVFIGDCLARAHECLRANQGVVAQVSFTHDEALNGQWRPGDVVHGCLCANFGMAQRLIGDYVGWWGTTYHTYGGDTEASLKYWEIGYRVEAREDCKVHHLRVDDALRRDNDAAERFYKIWTRERISSFPTSPTVSHAEMKAAKGRLVKLW